MFTSAQNTIILTIVFCLLTSSSLEGQITGVNPDKVSNQESTSDRSFKKMKEDVMRIYKNTPVKGNHKRALRSLHYWESRLDKNGNTFNHARANMDVVEQLFIDTFPALIQGEWQHIGPLTTIGTDFNQEGVGRVNQICFASASTWYAGTAGGGLWRTDVGGVYPGFGPYPWYPLTDSLPVLSISGIAAHPDNVDDVFILTGDGESISYTISGTQPGIGILHSTDGGVTWDPTALQYNITQQEAGYKLLRYPGSIDTMFAACTDGLYRTTDGWVSSASVINADTCYDIEFKPDDPQIVYAAFLGELRRSTDGGSFFQSITANLVQANIVPNSVMGRMAIAVSEDAPDVLYVLIANKVDGGLVSFQVSYDGGDTFAELADNDYNLLASADPETDTDGQGNYDLALWADPDDANTVIVGGVNLYKSTNSGLLWTQLVHWTNEPPEYTHADVHAIEESPAGRLIVGTDGGLYASSDGGFEWENRGHGLGISQFYHLDVWTGFLGIPFVSGGSQDNGTSTGFGFSDPTFEMIGGGDGFRTYRGTYDGADMRYRSTQNGRLYSQVLNVGIWGETLITPDAELDGNDLGLGAWDTPYQPNPNHFNELLAGYDDLYFSNTLGDGWVHLSYPSGYTYDNTKLISELAWSKVNGNVAFFFVSDSIKKHLYKCEALYVGVLSESLENASCTVAILDTNSQMPMTNPSDPGGGLSNSLSDIALSDYNSDEVWISIPGYTDSMKVYYNQDMAEDSPWVNITYNLPNVPVHCIEWSVDGLFAGTDIGAFFLHHGDSIWVYFSKGLPTVAVTEIEVRNTVSGRLIFASTWGRGMWWSTPPPALRRTRWYVDSSAMGAGTGADWANAFTELQIALDTILPGDSIWVAEGTYYPEGPSGFHLAYDNVRIWGGFDGTEDSVSQRDFIVNPTILSGDIGIPGDSTDNAFHVFAFGGFNGNVWLDGFHICDGYADGTLENTKGGGIYYSTGTLNGKPVIANCRIYNNTAVYKGIGHPGIGGGMYIADYDTGDPEMFVINCTFESNQGNKGGALYIDAYKEQIPYKAGTAIVHLDTCTFIENSSIGGGGGIYIEASQNSTAKVSIDSAIFDANALTYFNSDGAGIYCAVNSGGTLELECMNAHFNNQTANVQGDGGGILINGIGGTTTTTLIDCVFDSCNGVNGGAIYNFCEGGSSVSTFAMEGSVFTNNTGSQGAALHLNARYRGNTTSIFNNCQFLNNATTNGGALMFNGNGAGQLYSSIDSCTFTNNSATAAGGAIYIFGRNDNNGPGDIDFTLTNSLLQNNNASEGGALSFFCQVSVINSTISGTDFITNTGGSLGGAVRYVHVPLPGTSSINSNYTNCNFIANSVSLNLGGALFLDKINAAFEDCTFTGNIAKLGGAVYNYTTSANDTFTQSFINCGFFKNKATDFGGALCNRHDNPSLMVVDVVNSVFDSNYTTSASGGVGKGGAIYNTGVGRSVQNINNTIFEDNLATFDGGAIYAAGTGTNAIDTLFMNVDSCTFINNHAGSSAETVELYGHSKRIVSRWSNSDFYNDIVGIIFRNRQHISGISRAVFVNSNFH